MINAGAPVLRIRAVSKRFGEVLANEQVSFDVLPGEVHCLLGENGAGKSTLISMLAGMHTPDSGDIEIAGVPVKLTPATALAHGIGVVYQHSTLISNLTVLENVMLLAERRSRFWLHRTAAVERLRELSQLLGASFRPDAVVDQLSLAEQQQLEVVKALWRDARVLLLDEPTSLLAPSNAAALLASVRRLADSGIAVIFVSHKLDEVLQIADRCTVLRAGQVVFSTAARPDDVDGSLRRQLLSAMFGADGLGADELGADELGVGELGTEEFGGEEFGTGEFGTDELGAETGADPVMLSLDDVCTRQDRQGAPLSGLSLDVRAGEVLGVAGIEGQGQRALAEVIAGQRRAQRGRVVFEGVDITREPVAARWRRGVRYVSDDRLHEGTIGSLSVALNLMLKRIGERPMWRFGFMRRDAVRETAARLIAQYEIRTPSPEARAGELSGGNIQKILLARELSDGARLVVFDKPGQGLDLRAVQRTHGEIRSLAGRQGAAVLISSDIDELTALADRIVVLAAGRVVGQLKGHEPDARERIGALMVSGGERP